MLEHLLNLRIISLNNYAISLPNISIYLLLTAFLLLIFELYRYQLIRVRPTIERINKNPDGTYSVTWGYVNYTYKDVTLIENESSLVVNDGAAIIIGSTLPHHFLKGRHRRAFQTIVTEKSNVEWIIQKQRKCFIGLKSKGRDSNEKRPNV